MRSLTTLLLSLTLTSTAFAAVEKYCNGKPKMNGYNQALWPNGQVIDGASMQTFYPNGQKLVVNGRVVYPNGQTIADSATVYYPNGQPIFKKGSKLITNGVATYGSPTCYALNGGYLRCDKRLLVASGDTNFGVVMLELNLDQTVEPVKTIRQLRVTTDMDGAKLGYDVQINAKSVIGSKIVDILEYPSQPCVR